MREYMWCLHDTPQLKEKPRLNIACLACDTACLRKTSLHACSMLPLWGARPMWIDAGLQLILSEQSSMFPIHSGMQLHVNPSICRTIYRFHADFFCMMSCITKTMCEDSFFQRQLTFFRSCMALNIALVWTSSTFHAQSSIHEQCHVLATTSELLVYTPTLFGVIFPTQDCFPSSRHGLQQRFYMQSKIFFSGCNSMPWQWKAYSWSWNLFSWEQSHFIFQCEDCSFQRQLTFFRSCMALHIALVWTSSTFHAQSSIHEQCHVLATTSELLVYTPTLFGVIFPRRIAFLHPDMDCSNVSICNQRYLFQVAIPCHDNGKHIVEVETYFHESNHTLYFNAMIVLSNDSWLSSDPAWRLISLSFEHHQPSMRNLLYTNNVMCWQQLRSC